MREQLLKFLQTKPFRPFAVELDNQTSYQVPHPEYASVLRSILVIEDNDGAADLISIQHISRIQVTNLH